MIMHEVLMEYLIERPVRGKRMNLRSLFFKLFNNKTLLKQIDGLQADNAIAMDQCQLLKEHVQMLEDKISSMHAISELRTENKEHETPYSTAILLAKKGCQRAELISECGLTESEADLIMALHNKRVDPSVSTIAVN